MKRRGTYFVPTLAVMSDLAEPRGRSDDDIVLQLPDRRTCSPR